MSFFASVEMAPGDPILGLTETYLADPRPGKINLGVGIYVDEQGRIPLLPTSWVFRRGSRLRFSIAGTDANHMKQIPHGRPPVLTLTLGASALDLPLRPFVEPSR